MVESNLNSSIYTRFVNKYIEHCPALNGIVLKPFWTVLFTRPRIFNKLRGNFKHYITTYNADKPWSINEAFAYNKNTKFDEIHFLIQGISLPGEGVVNDLTQYPQNAGFIKAPISKGKRPYPLLTISFLDINSGFVDYVIRPWINIVALKSLKNNDIKCTITANLLMKTEAGFLPRKRVIFYGCAPIEVDNEEYDYNTPSGYSTRVTSWVYNIYEINDGNNVFNRLKYRRELSDYKLYTEERIEKDDVSEYPVLTRTRKSRNAIVDNLLNSAKQLGQNYAEQGINLLNNKLNVAGFNTNVLLGGNVAGNLLSGNFSSIGQGIISNLKSGSALEVWAKSELTSISLSNILSKIGLTSESSSPESQTAQDIIIPKGSAKGKKSSDIILEKIQDYVDYSKGMVKPINDITIKPANNVIENSFDILKDKTEDIPFSMDITDKIIDVKDVPMFNDLSSPDTGGKIPSQVAAPTDKKSTSSPARKMEASGGTLAQVTAMGEQDTPLHAGPAKEAGYEISYQDIPSVSLKIPDNVSINKDDTPTLRTKINDININKFDTADIKRNKGAIETINLNDTPLAITK